jgi:hypothetical protein
MFWKLADVREFCPALSEVVSRSMVNAFPHASPRWKQNGAIDRLKIPAWIGTCATLQDFVAAAMKRSIWPAIETLCDDGLTALYVGPIESVSDEGFTTLCYDAAGRWENAYSFRRRDVFRIEFDSRYCNHFNRYMRAKT